MPIEQLSQSDFDALIPALPAPALVCFSAPWCPACRALKPTLTRLADDAGDAYRVFLVDADADRSLLWRLGVRVLPTCLIYKNGAETYRAAGARTYADYRLELLGAPATTSPVPTEEGEKPMAKLTKAAQPKGAIDWSKLVQLAQQIGQMGPILFAMLQRLFDIFQEEKQAVRSSGDAGAVGDCPSPGRCLEKLRKAHTEFGALLDRCDAGACDEGVCYDMGEQALQMVVHSSHLCKCCEDGTV